MRLSAAALLPPLALLCSFASGFSISPKPISPSTSTTSSCRCASYTRNRINEYQMIERHRLPQHESIPAALFASGGAHYQAGSGSSIDMTSGKLLTSFWGTGGFVYILVRSIRKIVPIAMEPFRDGAVALNRFQLA